MAPQWVEATRRIADIAQTIRWQMMEKEEASYGAALPPPAQLSALAGRIITNKSPASSPLQLETRAGSGNRQVKLAKASHFDLMSGTRLFHPSLRQPSILFAEVKRHFRPPHRASRRCLHLRPIVDSEREEPSSTFTAHTQSHLADRLGPFHPSDAFPDSLKHPRHFSTAVDFHS
ncbi:uncharacterized protein CLUP02_13864 [Colletotrichum lupini]|uniref:Uncharacterized protein n=1 Tax=Colletotrichum lupini TaxID=145971 RepID=A0A9Q8WM58_9PEZI|nr:uncharacterized protein CLUP02_13864 [Colletotrichum lupini]UQC88341.1 hypothetical protein CLUP02_13864 [Colletotrichum lupini]